MDPGCESLEVLQCRQILLGSSKTTVLLVAIGALKLHRVTAIKTEMVSPKMRVIMFPSLPYTLLSPVPKVRLRELGIEETVGRAPVSSDRSDVKKPLRAKTVLVISAGGSIGRELAVQLSRKVPRLIPLDEDETDLPEKQVAVERSELLQLPNIVLADIRDSDAVLKVFLSHMPEILFHAAALQYLSLLEAFPEEPWKTNVREIKYSACHVFDTH